VDFAALFASTPDAIMSPLSNIFGEIVGNNIVSLPVLNIIKLCGGKCVTDVMAAIIKQYSDAFNGAIGDEIANNFTQIKTNTQICLLRSGIPVTNITRDRIADSIADAVFRAIDALNP